MFNNFKHTTLGSLSLRNGDPWDPFHITADLKHPTAFSIAGTAACRSPLNLLSGLVWVCRRPDRGGLVPPFEGLAAEAGHETKFVL